MTRNAYPRHRLHLPAVLLGLALAAAPLTGILPAPAASAAPRIGVESDAGTARASATTPTTLRISGSGFQSIPKAFGGIYVVFGYAPNQGSWRPSKGGKSGRDFLYVADSQSKANRGYQRFVSFPGSSTADSANGGSLSAAGGFRLSLTVPGPVITVPTATGSKSIDCRTVQCGVFTFGAHGVANGNNESFTPVSFAGTAKPAATPSATPATKPLVPTTTPGSTSPGTATPSTDTGTSPDQSAASEPPVAGDAGALPVTEGTVPRAVAAGKPRLGIEQKTVIAGRVLGFTGQGFAPGEQVVATVASGIVAAGPVTAGVFGEVAGAVQIPADMAPGTHRIKIAGAGSGTSAQAEFSVMTNPDSFAPAPESASQGTWWALVAVIAAGALLLLLVLSSLIAAIVKRRRKASAASNVEKTASETRAR